MVMDRLHLGFRMDAVRETNERSRVQRRWRKVAYGGRKPGYDDNYTEEAFLEATVMNANVVKRDANTVMQDSVAVARYIVSVWTYSLKTKLDEWYLLMMDAALLELGFSILLLTVGRISVCVCSIPILLCRQDLPSTGPSLGPSIQILSGPSSPVFS